jgi:hypothetical protein
MKNASILMKLGPDVDWTIASVTAYATGGRLKIANEHYSPFIFHQN